MFSRNLFPDFAINNISPSFSVLTVFLSVLFSAWDAHPCEKGGGKVNEGVDSALLCSANCHVRFARHLYLSPERIKRAPINTALTSRGHDFDWFACCASRWALNRYCNSRICIFGTARPEYAGNATGDYNQICRLSKGQRLARNYYHDEAVPRAFDNIILAIERFKTHQY